MSITIYTYKDPYKLNLEPYWEEIRTCPYFCASQTLVNGLKGVYRNDFQQGRVTTFKNLIETLFEYWESTPCIIKQHADIDNIITTGKPMSADPEFQKNMERAFLFNREEVFKSIRVMFELNMNVEDIRENQLTPEQKYIVSLYGVLRDSSKNKDFRLRDSFDDAAVNDALIKTMSKAHKEFDPVNVELDRVVIHGVHQFSPIMLRAIEEISAYKKVILLFNYQPQYKNMYQTWVDIYNAFDCPITESGGLEFRPSLQNPVSYEGNLLADRIGKLSNGQISSVKPAEPYEIIEFDNMTEFASYVADIFQTAEKEDPDNPMSKMREQIYAADSSANDILKIYFPEQFGERQFLDYPLGHFFIAVANMWDAVNNEILIEDINDVKECLDAGILQEDYLGQLSSIFGKAYALFEGCTRIDDMLSRLKRVRKNQRHLTDPDKKERLSHISYYSITIEEVEKLERALTDLDDLAGYFYEDFENRSHNFKEFYKRLKSYLQEEVLDTRDLGEEFADIIRRVLDRLDEVQDIDTSASFECLKSTMSIYLVQESKPGKSANWIVRGFEQIDGDIMRSHLQSAKPITYHFACLSDEDINSVNVPPFPWPLTDSFFEVAQEPVDWKYQVYVRSKSEYKNFKRYALLYGLEFNRAKFKLSYVKRDGDNERDPYYLLKILGLKKIPFEETRVGHFTQDNTDISARLGSTAPFNVYDYRRFQICKYRFLLESIIEKTTVYKDNFLLIKYFEVLLENRIKVELESLPISETMLIGKLNETFDELKKYFPFVLNVHKMDIINNIRSRLLDNKSHTYPKLTADERDYMMIRELFLHKQLADPYTHRKNILQGKFQTVSQDQIDHGLSEDSLTKYQFRKEADLWCKYCPNKDICAEFYAKVDS